MGNRYWIAHYRSRITNHRLRITDHTLPIADRDTRESPVKEMVKELKEFGVEVYGYDPLLSKEELEAFGVKALDNLNVKMDCVIVAVAHEEFKRFSFSTNLFLGRKALPKELYPFLAQVLSLERKCIDVRGMFEGEEAKRKGFYYRRL